MCINKMEILKELIDGEYADNKLYTDSFDIIESEVAAYNDDIDTFFNDLLTNGCVCGMIGALIYYEQTERFFLDHMSEIFDELNKYAETSELEALEEFNANNLAWFGFERVCDTLKNDMDCIYLQRVKEAEEREEN